MFLIEILTNNFMLTKNCPTCDSYKKGRQMYVEVKYKLCLAPDILMIEEAQ